MVRGEIYWCALNPTKGSEIRKTRPVAIVSPDEVNQSFRTVVVVPITSKGFSTPFRVACKVDGTSGLLLVDQLRTVDKERLGTCVGKLEEEKLQELLGVIRDFFE